MPRDLSDESEEIDDELRLDDQDVAELSAERGHLRNKLEVFGLPGWDLIVTEITAKREAHYRALASPKVDSMEAVSLIRGEVAVIESLLREPAITRERIAAIDEQLNELEPQEA